MNAICPGWVDTEMAWEGIDGFAEAIGATRDEAYREAMRDVPLRRMSEPADIAGTVAWLLSPDSRGVTGQAIDQNGGAWVVTRWTGRRGAAAPSRHQAAGSRTDVPSRCELALRGCSSSSSVPWRTGPLNQFLRLTGTTSRRRGFRSPPTMSGA